MAVVLCRALHGHCSSGQCHWPARDLSPPFLWLCCQRSLCISDVGLSLYKWLYLEKCSAKTGFNGEWILEIFKFPNSHLPPAWSPKRLHLKSGFHFLTFSVYEKIEFAVASQVYIFTRNEWMTSWKNDRILSFLKLLYLLKEGNASFFNKPLQGMAPTSLRIAL